MKPKMEYIKVCPRCGSTNVMKDMLTQGLTSLPHAQFINICKNCNFSGYLFPEIPINSINKFKKLLKK